MQNILKTPRNRETLVRVNTDWIDICHLSKSHSYRRIHSIFSNLSSEAPVGKEGVSYDEERRGETFLRRVVLDNVFVNDPQGKKTFQKFFPGARPTVLNKNEMRVFLDKEYQVTIKGSDSVRGMLVSLSAPRFPRWERKVTSSNENVDWSTVKFNLKDLCIIESHYQNLVSIDKESCEIQLSGGMFILEHNASSNRVYLFDTVVSFREEIVRKQGRILNYFCDQSFVFYLLLDEICFPIYKENQFRTFHNIVLLDGELIINANKELRFYAFDVVTYCEERKVISCVNFSTKDKINILRKRIYAPFVKFYKENPKYTFPRIAIEIKEFMNILEIGEMYQRLNKKNRLYNGKYQIDSFIFLPGEDPLLYRQNSSISTNMLKFKLFTPYPVDFLCFYNEKESKKLAKRDTICMDLFYRSYEDHSVFKTVEMNISYLDEDTKMDIVSDVCRIEGLVCSCTLVQPKRNENWNWFIYKVINIKSKKADFFSSIVQMFQVGIEGVTQIDLLKAARKIRFYEPQNFIEEYKSRIEKNGLEFYGKLYNQYKRNQMEIQVLHEKKIQIDEDVHEGEEEEKYKWKKIRNIYDCVGPDFSRGKKLNGFILDFFNKGKRCVKVIYLPSGMFQIVGFGEDEDLEKSTAKSMIEKMKLMWEIIDGLRNEQTMKHSRNENSEDEENEEIDDEDDDDDDEKKEPLHKYRKIE